MTPERFKKFHVGQFMDLDSPDTDNEAWEVNCAEFAYVMLRELRTGTADHRLNPQERLFIRVKMWYS